MRKIFIVLIHNVSSLKHTIRMHRYPPDCAFDDNTLTHLNRNYDQIADTCCSLHSSAATTFPLIIQLHQIPPDKINSTIGIWWAVIYWWNGDKDALSNAIIFYSLYTNIIQFDICQMYFDIIIIIKYLLFPSRERHEMCACGALNLRDTQDIC